MECVRFPSSRRFNHFTFFLFCLRTTHSNICLSKVLVYCQAQRNQPDELIHISSRSLAQLLDAVALRPLCTPFRLTFRSNRSVFDTVEEWAMLLRLANAAASERKDLFTEVITSLISTLSDPLYAVSLRYTCVLVFQLHYQLSIDFC